MCVITTSKCFLAFVHIWFHRNIEHVRASLEEGRKVRCFNQLYLSVNIKIGLFTEIGYYKNQSKSLISFNAFNNFFSAQYQFYIMICKLNASSKFTYMSTCVMPWYANSSEQYSNSALDDEDCYFSRDDQFLIIQFQLK